MKPSNLKLENWLIHFRIRKSHKFLLNYKLDGAEIKNVTSICAVPNIYAKRRATKSMHSKKTLEDKNCQQMGDIILKATPAPHFFIAKYGSFIKFLYWKLHQRHYQWWKFVTQSQPIILPPHPSTILSTSTLQFSTIIYTHSLEFTILKL